MPLFHLAGTLHFIPYLVYKHILLLRITNGQFPIGVVPLFTLAGRWDI
jgi:hypothetical protein